MLFGFHINVALRHTAADMNLSGLLYAFTQEHVLLLIYIFNAGSMTRPFDQQGISEKEVAHNFSSQGSRQTHCDA